MTEFSIEHERDFSQLFVDTLPLERMVWTQHSRRVTSDYCNQADILPSI
jgi:hypothetical protein